MLNTICLNNSIPLPISQIFKFGVIIILFIRLIPTKDIWFLILLLLIFQIAPLCGLIKTHDFAGYYDDVVVGAKWFNVPLSFFYFKTLFQSSQISSLFGSIKNFIKTSFGLLTFNMVLGALGFGAAFYYEGYGNSIGTKGLIYAGNELTILVLALSFVIACYFKERKQYKHYFILLIVFMAFSFLMTSKTVMAGTLIVFLIPWVNSLRSRFQKKWVERVFLFMILGLPFIVLGVYYGVVNSGFLDKLKYSKKINDGDFLTVLLSNRNVALEDGWYVFTHSYNFIEKFFGLGQSYYKSLVWRAPELDFFTLLFTGGILSLLLLLFLYAYWFFNAKYLSKLKGFIYAKHVFIYLIFLLFAANTAGHILNSGIAGYYIGFSIAIMFYKNEKYLQTG